ncbi:MAG: hypothetical protein AB4206_07145 [Xenococcaceae cyanobacterium]
MKLFLSTQKIISRALLSTSITTISLNSAISAANGTTLARSQSSLQFTNFSHTPTEVSQFQSAFAYVLSGDDFAIIKSDPMYVTGVPVLFHPLSPQFPAISTSVPGENSVVAPFQFKSATGNTFGQNSVSYSGSISNQLSSANLSSGSTFSVKNNNHFISTVGQSGFNFSFFLEPEDKLTFDFHSASEVQALTDKSSVAEVEETQVIYFLTQPADVDNNNGILMLSLYPQLHLSANDPRIEVDLLELTTNSTSEGTYSRTINYNGSPEESSSYFNLSTPPNTGDDITGTFAYTAKEPTIFTAVAYTSSFAASFNSTKIPESSTRLSLIYLSLIVIGTNIVNLFRI